MHPLAVMGLLAVLGGVVLIVYTFYLLSREALWVILFNLPPLLLFIGGLALSLRRLRAGRDANALLVGTFIGAILLWILLGSVPR